MSLILNIFLLFVNSVIWCLLGFSISDTDNSNQIRKVMKDMDKELDFVEVSMNDQKRFDALTNEERSEIIEKIFKLKGATEVLVKLLK